MMRYLLGCIAMCLLGATLYGASLADAALERPLQTALQRARDPFVKHLRYLRYYKTKDKPRQEPNNPQRQHEYALALYLINLFASTHVYAENPPSFTLEYLGVFDGFEHSWKPFDFAKATQFYKDHQAAVDELFNQYLQMGSYPWEPPTQAQRLQWVQLLETRPRKERQAVFEKPSAALGAWFLPDGVAQRLAPLLAQAKPDILKQAVLYDEPDISLADFDSHVGIHRPRRKLTYRWVREECFYSSYLIAKHLTHALETARTAWGNTHIYLLTAHPKYGEFLRPPQGQRFVLANGQPGLNWRYHTAALVILEHNNRLVPVVVDTFLTGDTPVSLEKWLTHFHVHTQLRATPFMRNESTEQALQVPSKIEGRAIWFSGNKYEPAEVLR